MADAFTTGPTFGATKQALPSTPDKGQIPFLDAENPVQQTPAPKASPSSLVVTSGPARTQYSKDNSALANAMNVFGLSQDSQNPPINPNKPGTVAGDDPILSQIESLKSGSDAATASLLSSTQAQYQNSINKETARAGDYQRGLETLGIQTNQAKSTPDILSGHITQAASDSLDKINSLKAEEAKVIMQAKSAQADKNFSLLKESMQRYKDIQTEKTTAVKNMYDTLSQSTKTADIQAHQIYDTLNTLDAGDKEKFLVAVAKKYGIPVTTLVTSLTDEKAKRDKAAVKTSKTSSTANSKAELAQGIDVLNTGKLPDGTVLGNAKGKDGYVDPGVYNALYGYWKGSNAAFLKAYPVTQVNPQSYDKLPEAIRPKTTTTSSSQGS